MSETERNLRPGSLDALLFAAFSAGFDYGFEEADAGGDSPGFDEWRGNLTAGNGRGA